MQPEQIDRTVRDRLADREPEVELLTCRLRGDTVELYIDHPDGVSLELCERVTHALPEIREHHALTVSSPGTERPLVRPEHFRRFVGATAKVRTLAPRDGRSTFTGEIVGADDSGVTLATASGLVSIPYDAVRASNLVES